MMINKITNQIAMNITNNKKFNMNKSQIAKWIPILLPKKLIKI